MHSLGSKEERTENNFDFLGHCKRTSSNIVLLHNSKRNFYLGGNRPGHETFDDLFDEIYDIVQLVKPSKVMVVGCSAGGLAALATAEKMKVDSIHLFNPHTYVNRFNILRYWDPDLRDKKNRQYLKNVQALPKEMHKYFDGAKILGRIDKSLKCYVHYCKFYRRDRVRVGHIKKKKQVVSLAHNCKVHNCDVFLHRSNVLGTIFEMEKEWLPPQQLLSN